jgi:SAM-dependent methyltransferase
VNDGFDSNRGRCLVPNSLSVAAEQQYPTNGSDVRFAFGKNWQRFLRYLNEERIVEAEKSLRTMLGVDTLSGKTFLDIGCGSGLFSLAAMRLGAAKVHSFDYDSQSAACAQELKRRFFPGALNWTAEQGSVLDQEYLRHLGQFDVVYSWGVLHHTGNMWQALGNVVPHVAPSGRLFLAIYNDQGRISQFWKVVKRLYNKGKFFRLPIIVIFGSYLSMGGLIKDLIALRNPLRRYRDYKRSRGMSYFTDLLDWLGGYPFEVARPEDIFEFFRIRGFQLFKLKTAGGRLGNNEFVFSKIAG